MFSSCFSFSSSLEEEDLLLPEEWPSHGVLVLWLPGFPKGPFPLDPWVPMGPKIQLPFWNKRLQPAANVFLKSCNGNHGRAGRGHGQTAVPAIKLAATSHTVAGAQGQGHAWGQVAFDATARNRTPTQSKEPSTHIRHCLSSQLFASLVLTWGRRQAYIRKY